MVSKALEINEELLNFLQIKGSASGVVNNESAEEKASKLKEKADENDQMEEYEEELEEDQFQDNQGSANQGESSMNSKLPPNFGGNLGVIYSN